MSTKSSSRYLLSPVLAAAALSFFTPSPARAQCSQKFFSGGCVNLKPEQVNTPSTSKIPGDAAVQQSLTVEPDEPATKVSIHIGNESGQVDGVRGPFTYGFNVSHDFKNGMNLEGTMTRLHERGTPVTKSLLDEAQLTLHFKETRLLGQPIQLSATAWKNRMMDMYTNVGGIEVARPGKHITLNGGLYAGSATLDDEKGRFLGFLVGASGSIHGIDIAVDHMNGAIRTPGDASALGEGRYSHTGISASKNLNLAGKLPLTVSGTFEKRAFDFGNGGSVNDPRDGMIFITGVEVDARDLLHAFKHSGAASGSAR